ncbi:MAG: hypothetical protein H7A24_17970 [Leptospiraceae bacterium]|nr:hypothetical protein [Leptospiraceae bacterium]MCP5513783.1 hypothetical protein [Leptospiraceae bacterium]
MPSHKIVLTNKGFKTLGSEMFVDIVHLFFSLLALSFFSYLHNQYSLQFTLFYIISILIYIFYRIKNGHFYPFSYFYQISIFFLITPLIFLNWVTLPISMALLAVSLFKKNPFKEIYFPMGLFLSLISISIGIIMEKHHIFQTLLTPPQNPDTFLLHSNLSGIFFYSFENPVGAIDFKNFSIVESYGLYIMVFISPFLLKKYNLFSDALVLAGMFFLIGMHYQNEFQTLQDRIINTTCLWFLIYTSPGRNHGFSFLFSFISLVFTMGISYLSLKGNLEYPIVLTILGFFLIQSALFLLIREKILVKTILFKNLLRK